MKQTMKYQLGKYVFTKDEEYRYEDIYTNGEYLEFEKKTLIDLGATPIDDKPECLHEGDKTNFNPQYCHKCGNEFIYDRFCSPEWKGQHSPDCQCHKKIEPMEIKPTDEDSRALTKTIQKVYEIIDWINSQNKGE